MELAINELDDFLKGFRETLDCAAKFVLVDNVSFDKKEGEGFQVVIVNSEEVKCGGLKVMMKLAEAAKTAFSDDSEDTDGAGDVRPVVKRKGRKTKGAK